MDTVIRHARVLTLDSEGTEFEEADIVVRDDKIVALGPNAAQDCPAAARVIEGRGKLVMPGLVNGHFHSPMNLIKGALDDLPLELYMLYEVPPLADSPVSREIAYLRTMLAALDLLKQGVTAIHDDVFCIPVPTEGEMDGIMEAYRDSGIRANVAINHGNLVEYEKLPFLGELIPPAVRRRMDAASPPAAEDLLAINRDFIARWHGGGEGRLRASLSCSAPQRVTPDYLAALSELSAQHDIPYNMHILETKLQRVFGEERFGKSLVRYAHEAGVLNERVVVIHAIWIDEEDIACLAESGCSVAHNPVCNLKLGSGVMPFRRLRDAGVNICLGIDEVPADDGMNFWFVGKTAGLIHKIADPEYLNWPKAPEILQAMTRGGAKAMGLEGRCGVLAPGACADLILLDLSGLAYTPLIDLQRQLVFCETGASVEMTMVAGRIVVEQGRVQTVDEAAIKQAVHDMTPDIRRYLETCREQAEALMPYYREMYLRAAGRDVGLQRWVASRP